MATPLERSARPSIRDRRLVGREALGALVLAAAVPLLFLHERYQPALELDLGSTSVALRPSDAAILAVVVAALVTWRRTGRSSLGASRFLWIVGGLLLAWLAFQVLRPASLDDARFADHLVSFLKFAEYAVLAPAAALLVRTARDLTIVLGALVLWAVPACLVGIVQFGGADIFDAWNRGWRQPSFLGHHDFAALAGLVASLGIARMLAGRRRVPVARLFPVAVVVGVLGLVLAGSVAAAGGFAVGGIVAALAARPRFSPSPRQLIAVVATVAIVLAGVSTLRGTELGDFLRFVGLRGEGSPSGVESYSHRTVLAYIGLRVFEDNPVAGVGWLRSGRPEVFEPYVADARARFPDVSDLAFPAEGREHGVQNLYVQMLADAGVIGLALLLLVGVAGIVLTVRTIRYAPHPWAAGAGLTALCALVTLAGEWASMGVVAGIPLQAATCLLLGLAAAGAAVAREEERG